jgi:acetyl-CoA carboxylase beta subunit
MNISKTKVITINNKDKDKHELKESKMAICLQCQGIGYIKKNKKDYMKCIMCWGDLYISKNKVANILGGN